jgi:hypothetical protein
MLDGFLACTEKPIKFGLLILLYFPWVFLDEKLFKGVKFLVKRTSIVFIG